MTPEVGEIPLRRWGWRTLTFILYLLLYPSAEVLMCFVSGRIRKVTDLRTGETRTIVIFYRRAGK